MKKNNKVGKFFLTFFLGFLGSFIINHSKLKPEGYKSRTAAYFFLGIITFGIYPLVASICNFSFDPNKEKNIGYFKQKPKAEAVNAIPEAEVKEVKEEVKEEPKKEVKKETKKSTK